VVRLRNGRTKTKKVMHKKRFELWFRKTEHIPGHLWQIFCNC
jgi:hypothetical protein